MIPAVNIDPIHDISKSGWPSCVVVKSYTGTYSYIMTIYYSVGAVQRKCVELVVDSEKIMRLKK